MGTIPEHTRTTTLDYYLMPEPGDDSLKKCHNRHILSSANLESRDNPFVPGGELSIDTDDILKRATIVRDRFILNEEEKKKKAAAEEEAQRKKKQAAAPGGDASLISNAAVEGVQENGKVEEVPLEAESAKTAECEAPEGPASPQASQDDGRADTAGTAATDTREAAALKEKKKQKKCCTIM
ncbi:uncharacterized protein LOC115226693 isoform X1 [Octopus sinensis]|uniref:Uncharacterized protein LOC115226693 isoform X1 n=1 Tax=Octopus sinensis TaxID=2607531 RepID=A0A6P7TNC7_9MOLL|nr:uncharacterized protein LOC115226693 isoform X1 [Octopus sinensis]